MKDKLVWLDRILALGSLALGIVSIFINDVDKCPIYFMLAYALWRVS